jgi:hypothetical protein
MSEEKFPKVNQCPICHKTKDVIKERMTHGSSAGCSGVGVFRGDRDYYFYCVKCSFRFNVTIEYWGISKEEYLKQNTGYSGLQG